MMIVSVFQVPVHHSTQIFILRVFFPKAGKIEMGSIFYLQILAFLTNASKAKIDAR